MQLWKTPTRKQNKRYVHLPVNISYHLIVIMSPIFLNSFLCSILNQVFELFVQLVLQVEELKNSHHSPNRSQNMVSKNISLSNADSGTFPPVVAPTNTTNISMLSRHQRRNNVKMKDPNCENLKAFTILPNDSSKEVRKKQGTYLNCIHKHRNLFFKGK